MRTRNQPEARGVATTTRLPHYFGRPCPRVLRPQMLSYNPRMLWRIVAACGAACSLIATILLLTGQKCAAIPLGIGTLGLLPEAVRDLRQRSADHNANPL